jgi:hypothetical protein
MKRLMQFLIEVYTDVFCAVRKEYAKELLRIESESEYIEFSDFEDLVQSIE